MSDAGPSDDSPVAEPTWKDNIAHFFDDDEVGCMKQHGIDLSSYDSVVSHASNIFEKTQSGAMPMGKPRWPATQVQTFLNWIDNGFAAAPLVAHPTYERDIRHFFTKADIADWKPKGIDLSTCAGVKASAAEIRDLTDSGEMPAVGPPWSDNRKKTFANWMADDYPPGMGLPSPRLRKNAKDLSADEIAKLKKAFWEIMRRDPQPDDSGKAIGPINDQSYFALACLHGQPGGYCVHHVDAFHPWHRVYMTQFEEALRSVEGCEDVTLPYWDITEPVPDLLYEPPFDRYVIRCDIGETVHPIPYETVRNSAEIIADYLAVFRTAGRIEQAVSQPDWGAVDSGGYSQPIMEAHDNGHMSGGPTLFDQDVAAFDPLFWFYHCYLDSVFWSWQVAAGATTVEGFEKTLPIVPGPAGTTPPARNDDWLDLSLDPWPISTSDVIPYPVSYDRLVAPDRTLAGKGAGHIDAARTFAIPATAPVSVRVKDINRMSIPGSFVVHLLGDGEPIASQAFFQPTSAADCRTCRKRELVSVDFKVGLDSVQGKALSVRIEVPIRGETDLPLSRVGNPTINVRLLLEESWSGAARPQAG